MGDLGHSDDSHWGWEWGSHLVTVFSKFRSLLALRNLHLGPTGRPLLNSGWQQLQGSYLSPWANHSPCEWMALPTTPPPHLPPRVTIAIAGARRNWHFAFMNSTIHLPLFVGSSQGNPVLLGKVEALASTLHRFCHYVGIHQCQDLLKTCHLLPKRTVCESIQIVPESPHLINTFYELRENFLP